MRPGDLLRAGDLGAAAKLARRLLAEHPGDADAQHALALEALSLGTVSKAIEWLERSVASDPGNAWYWCNLAHARMQASADHAADAVGAIEASRNALKLNPGYAQASFNLGCALLAAGQYDEASAEFRNLVQRFPENADYVCALGDAQRNLGLWREASRHYRKALELDVDHVRAESNLGALLAGFGESEQARAHCMRAVRKAPDSWQAHHLLGRCHYQLEAFDEAMDAYANAFELHPGFTDLSVDIARVWQENGDLAEAYAWYQRALATSPDNVAARSGLASILLDQGQSVAALAVLAEIMETHGGDADLLRVHAQCLWSEGDADGAVSSLRAAQAAQPNNAALFALSGQILASAGRIESAHAEFATALNLNPRCAPALSGLASSQRGALEPDRARAMQELLENARLRDGAKATLHSGLAHYHDGLKDWRAAAEHMAMANACQWKHREKRGQAYDRDAFARRCERIRSVFSAVHFSRVAESGDGSLLPAFIVGMPRSGTTLTEQILARHPQVLGIGERNFAAQSFHSVRSRTRPCESDEDEELTLLDMVDRLDIGSLRSIAARYLSQLEALATSQGKPMASRIVDKMPDNYSLVGWIATLFPNARIIHCRRDLRDVALSCWMTQFGKIPWASRWPDLLHRITQYQALMQHWREVLPGRFIEVDYETTVNNQEAESRRMIDWLGLPWDPACLEHYAGEGLVRTASITQVRQPIYTRSVARWEHYLPHIPELGAIYAAGP